jgi:hypothetical protein
LPCGEKSEDSLSLLIPTIVARTTGEAMGHLTCSHRKLMFMGGTRPWSAGGNQKSHHFGLATLVRGWHDASPVRASSLH